ncbi:MAG: RidA family protein [Candidatus Sulfopaludibacter sp.]|nr:RidA family protein [Candidatus Sulfopaludibacter sp.]
MRLPGQMVRAGAFWRFRLVALVCGLSLLALPAQRKKKEEETQTLQLPRELPGSLMGDTRRLTFYVTPLSNKGLLSPQIRDALKALSRQTGSDTVLKIRAFVAGSGDVRRVRDLVSEVFTDRRLPLPVLSLVRSGGLPLEGAQVVLEAIAQSRKEVNPSGLAFLSGQVAGNPDPANPVAPLMEQSLSALRREVKAAGAEPADVLRVTCFLSSLENVSTARQLLETEYPRAARDFVQTQRAPGRAVAACEGVARLRSAPDSRLSFAPAEGLPGDAGQSPVALVGARQVVLTGTQISFGYQEQDSRLAFDRLKKELDQSGVSLQDIAFAHYYPLSSGIAAQVRKIRAEVFDPAHPPAGTMLQFEGLPSMDAGFAVDVVAVK